MISAAQPGDLVELVDTAERVVFRVGAIFGVEHSGRGKKRKGVATNVMVDNLDPDSLRPIPFKPGYRFESGLVTPDLECELVASVEFMRGLRRRPARATLDDEQEVDPMQRQQKPQHALVELHLDTKDVPF